MTTVAQQVSHTHIQSKLGWQTLETRRLHQQLVFLYKIKYNLLNISLPQHLIFPCTRTRNSDPNKCVQIPTRINTYAYSFYPRVIRAWNLLPNEIIRLPSIDTFHQAVSTFKLAPPAHLNRLLIRIVVNMKCYFRTFLFKSFIRNVYFYITVCTQIMRTKPVNSDVSPRKGGCLEYKSQRTKNVLSRFATE